MKTALASALVLAVFSPVWAVKPVDWVNLDEAHHFGGRVTSSGYLRGKIVMVDCRDYGDKKGVEEMLRIQDIWASFKTKPFVLVGSHRGEATAERIDRISRGLGLTYPIYKDGALAAGEPEEAKKGAIYVVDSRGTVIYHGKDDRAAVSAVASSLLAMRNPQTPPQWEALLDYDLDVLPGRAFNELCEYRRRFPEEAKVYDSVFADLRDDKDVQRLAKLEEVSQQAKDYDRNEKGAKRIKTARIKEILSKYGELKKLENPIYAQEAKNCLADMTWALALLEAE